MRGVGCRMTVVPSRDLLSLGTSVGAGDRIITGQRIPVVVPSRRTPTPWSCLRWRAPLDKLCSPPRVRPSVLLAVRSGGSRLRDAGDRPDEAYHLAAIRVVTKTVGLRASARRRYRAHSRTCAFHEIFRTAVDSSSSRSRSLRRTQAALRYVRLLRSACATSAGCWPW